MNKGTIQNQIKMTKYQETNGAVAVLTYEQVRELNALLGETTDPSKRAGLASIVLDYLTHQDESLRMDPEYQRLVRACTEARKSLTQEVLKAFGARSLPSGLTEKISKILRGK